MRSAKLTDRQQQVLSLVRTHINHTGAPPTRAEIAAALGFKSANAAEEHLQALARKGAIELISSTSRGIRVKDWGEDSSAIAATAATLRIPLLGHVAAGSPILAQAHVVQTHQIEASLFSQTPDYLLRVRGMSMRDAGILDGDLLAVAATREARNGQIIVARLGEEVTVKRFERLPTHIALHAENPDHPTIVVQPNEPFEIEGLAVGLIRKQFQP